MESSDKAERGLGFEELLGAQGVAVWEAEHRTL